MHKNENENNALEGIKMPSKGTHKGNILHQLLCGEMIDNKQQFGILETCASAARICELRNDGWNILDRPYNAEGGRSKQYFIPFSDLTEYRKQPIVKKFIGHGEVDIAN